ncbi:MAG: alkaline phosphatase D family protein [Opitutaceae bacterium]|nr:alkaline phosphatase D family protein [Opitutaceae bacterium]
MILSLATAPFSAAAEIHLAQGVLAGEVTATSAILQARLTAGPGLVNGDVPGVRGVARFEIAIAESFSGARQTAWIDATAEHDFIVKSAIDGLKPATTYFFRADFGAGRTRTRRSAIARFKTLPEATAIAPVNFILTSCQNYAFFRDGGAKGQPAYQGKDRDLGYPAIDHVIRLQPDFCIFDGDCVYYDHPAATRAQTIEQLRRKWHEQYVMPRFVTLFSRVPTYWLKDDHDYRMNDSDPTGDYAPSHALGIATFREQVPVVNPSDPRAVTYRTHRMGRDLQLWMVEGRDYRSPNRMDDGPEKTIWGAEQKAWLQRTLKASDATFKILVSPTPMVGPDDGSKRDNHVNPRGFHHEGEAFFAWLKENGIPPGRFYVICGDRHWKYHSRHPSGYDELGCGTFNRENSRLGRAPGDPQSTDASAIIRQMYTDNPPSGGFMRVAVKPATGAGAAQIEFEHYDDYGAVLYRYSQNAK